MGSLATHAAVRVSFFSNFRNELRIAPQISTGIDVSRALMGTDKLLEIGERECSQTTTARQGHAMYHGVKNIMLQARALPSTGSILH